MESGGSPGYRDAEGAAESLPGAGFLDLETSVEPALTVLDRAEHCNEFVRDIIFGRHLENIPAGEQPCAFPGNPDRAGRRRRSAIFAGLLEIESARAEPIKPVYFTESSIQCKYDALPSSTGITMHSGTS